MTKTDIPKKIINFNKFIASFERFLKAKENSLNEHIESLLEQVIETAKSISLLIENGHLSQAMILLRALGENVILLVVLASLKEKPREAYSAIYELHGYYEFEKLADKGDSLKKAEYEKLKPHIEKHKELLKKKILEEFKEEDEEITESKMKQFVKDKINKYIYDDALFLADHADTILMLDKKLFSNLLKSSMSYQWESQHTHSTFLAMISFKNKDSYDKLSAGLVNETIKRILLVWWVYSMGSGEIENLIKKLII